MKKNINFSEAEINFLNNFSSIAELHSFAESFDEVLQKVKDYVNENETLKNIKDYIKLNDYWAFPAAGAVGGAGVGAVGGILLGDKQKPKLRRALMGAGIGAGVGAGIGTAGLAYKKNRDLNEAIDRGELYKMNWDMAAEESAKEFVINKELQKKLNAVTSQRDFLLEKMDSIAARLDSIGKSMELK